MTEVFSLLRDDYSKKYCLIDVETESLCLNEIRNLPWQLSMITWQENQVKEFDFYIKWPQGIKVSAGAAIVTRYDPLVVKEKGFAPEFVLGEMDRELRDCDFVMAHNGIGFDNYIIQGFYRQLGKKPYNIIPKLLDTFAIAKSIKMQIEFNKETDDLAAWQYRLYHKIKKGLKCGLGALGKEYGIEHNYESLHDGLSDIRLNKKLWDKIKYQVNI